VFLAAVADGQTEITPWPEADDCRWSAEVARRIGAQVERSAGLLRIRGVGAAGPRILGDLPCGESGTTLRLAAGLLAGYPVTARLTAEPSLSRRPMRRIAEPLRAMGAAIEGREGEGATDLFPPLTIRGAFPLKGLHYQMPVASAQVKSAVLLAGLRADGPTTVTEPWPTRDHTERMLAHFGAAVERSGRDVRVMPGPLRSPGKLQVPGDFSSAAFFLVGAACLPEAYLTVEGVSLNPSRTHLLEMLRRLGATVSVEVTDEGWEPRGRISVQPAPLRAIDVTPGESAAMIDELPILMVAAACAEGTSRFEGIGELRVKETDRVQSMLEGLRGLGADIRLAEADALEITGGPLTGAAVASAGDHRTAMSLAIAGLAAQGETTVQGAEAVAKSFPDFFDRLRLLVGDSTAITVDKA
jgi:3-phosphoshikimate 1-carboxyvinyltransferase